MRCDAFYFSFGLLLSRLSKYSDFSLGNYAGGIRCGGGVNGLEAGLCDVGDRYLWIRNCGLICEFGMDWNAKKTWTKPYGGGWRTIKTFEWQETNCTCFLVVYLHTCIGLHYIKGLIKGGWPLTTEKKERKRPRCIYLYKHTNRTWWVKLFDKVLRSKVIMHGKDEWHNYFNITDPLQYFFLHILLLKSYSRRGYIVKQLTSQSCINLKHTKWTTQLWILSNKLTFQTHRLLEYSASKVGAMPPINMWAGSLIIRM
jgi:hypothetical protein